MTVAPLPADRTGRGETVQADRWVIEVKPIGPGPPVAVRVRRLLKAMLRGYGLKAVLVRDPAAPGE